MRYGEEQLRRIMRYTKPESNQRLAVKRVFPYEVDNAWGKYQTAMLIYLILDKRVGEP